MARAFGSLATGPAAAYPPCLLEPSRVQNHVNQTAGPQQTVPPGVSGCARPFLAGGVSCGHRGDLRAAADRHCQAACASCRNGGCAGHGRARGPTGGRRRSGTTPPRSVPTDPRLIRSPARRRPVRPKDRWGPARCWLRSLRPRRQKAIARARRARANSACTRVGIAGARTAEPPLNVTRGKQLPAPGRKAYRGRRCGKDPKSGDEHPALPEHVSGPGAGQKEAADGRRMEALHPGQPSPQRSRGRA